MILSGAYAERIAVTPIEQRLTYSLDHYFGVTGKACSTVVTYSVRSLHMGYIQRARGRLEL